MDYAKTRYSDRLQTSYRCDMSAVLTTFALFKGAHNRSRRADWISMRIFLSIIRVVCLVTLPISLAVAQRLTSDEVRPPLEEIRSEVLNLQLDYGRLDPRMLEPLEQFSQQLIDAQFFNEALEVLDQAIQIVRFSEGLYSPSQFPFLIRRIETFGNQGNWVEARELIEHATWLLNRQENEINTSWLDSMLQLTDIHLWGVASDLLPLQSYHFRQAERLNSTAVRASKFALDPKDTRLPEFIYKQVLQEYLQSVAVEAGGKTSISLRRYSSRGLAHTRRDSRASSYFSGLYKLAEIYALFESQDQPDLEGMAMVEIYLGDWQVLFGNSEAAARSYARANQLLLDAGIDQLTINRVFAEPKLLPAFNFISSWEQALAGLDARDQPSPSVEDVSNFSFRQWSPQFPYSKAPVDYGADDSLEMDDEYAIFSFNLAGLEEGGRWHRGRFRKGVSSPRDLELLTINFREPVDRMELENSILNLNFRPKLEDGAPQSVNATLSYQFAGE